VSEEVIYETADEAGAYDTTEGKVYNLSGGDWDEVEGDEGIAQRVVVNMGPQHPSTHGVLRLILELDGENVTQARSGIGYLQKPPTAWASRSCWASPIRSRTGQRSSG